MGELSLGLVKTKGPTTREQTGPSKGLGWGSARVRTGAGEEGGAFLLGDQDAQEMTRR